MDKQELLHMLRIRRRVVYNAPEVHAYDTAIQLAEQLDKPEKVMIPQFVVDYLETRKETHPLGGLAGAIFYALNSRNDPELNNWMNQNGEVFARAWLDGYKVKEPLYRVVLPQFQFNEKAGELQTVNLSLAWDFQSDETRLISFSGSNTTRFKTNLTEKEIKSIDERFWAFAVPVEEG